MLQKEVKIYKSLGSLDFHLCKNFPYEFKVLISCFTFFDYNKTLILCIMVPPQSIWQQSRLYGMLARQRWWFYFRLGLLFSLLPSYLTSTRLQLNTTHPYIILKLNGGDHLVESQAQQKQKWPKMITLCVISHVSLHVGLFW